MSARSPANPTVVLWYCVAMCCVAVDAAAAGQFLVTVLRSSDPVEVRALLADPPSRAGAGLDGLQRDIRTSGYGRQRHDRWQVVVSEGQPAFVATGRLTPQLQIPWIELNRHGPVPHAVLTGQGRLDGLYVQAKRLQNEVELQLYQFGDPAVAGSLPASPGAGLRTVVRGPPGRWLDAGGNLLLENPPAERHGYGVRHGDPRHSRLLLRVDALD